jgi:hypothetical protein
MRMCNAKGGRLTLAGVDNASRAVMSRYIIKLADSFPNKSERRDSPQKTRRPLPTTTTTTTTPAPLLRYSVTPLPARANIKHVFVDVVAAPPVTAGVERESQSRSHSPSHSPRASLSPSLCVCVCARARALCEGGREEASSARASS